MCSGQQPNTTLEDEWRNIENYNADYERPFWGRFRKQTTTLATDNLLENTDAVLQSLLLPPPSPSVSFYFC